MDRLIIESILADVNEIYLSDADNNGDKPAVVLGFKGSNNDKVLNAWLILKDIAYQHDTDLLICETMIAGIYDLEIKTPGLDEPLRIMNKAISGETLAAIEELVNGNMRIRLGTSVSEKENWIELHSTLIRECTPRH